MRIPHTICGFRLQFADSTDSCGFRDSLNLLNTCIIICSWIPQTCSGFQKIICGFRKVICFWSNFEQFSVLAICPWNPNQQKGSKKAMLRIPPQIWFLPVAESAYNSQNAQFGLVMKNLTFLFFEIKQTEFAVAAMQVFSHSSIHTELIHTAQLLSCLLTLDILRRLKLRHCWVMRCSCTE